MVLTSDFPLACNATFDLLFTHPVNPTPSVIIPNVHQSASYLRSVQSSSSQLLLPNSEIKKCTKYTSELNKKLQKRYIEK
ncbi:hypothetical protein CRE_05121 [Caenorhabditis remanei]|uniref:Uncharacterized protein n=1 Tax=Caenorhabditis remanei TaxID=31234 RepID=E3N6B0_CAERE|nr:hypothetical protein CRE_05121 [Caenorhabditis remanei]